MMKNRKLQAPNDLPAEVAFERLYVLPSSVYIAFRNEQQLQYILQHAEIDSSQYSLEDYPQQPQEQLQEQEQLQQLQRPNHHHHHVPTNTTTTSARATTTNTSPRVSTTNLSLEEESQSVNAVMGALEQRSSATQIWCPLTRHLVRAFKRKDQPQLQQQQQQQQPNHDNDNDDDVHANNNDKNQDVDDEVLQQTIAPTMTRTKTNQFKRLNHGVRTRAVTAPTIPPSKAAPAIPEDPSSPLDIHPVQVTQNMIRTYKAQQQKQQQQAALTLGTVQADPIAIVKSALKVSKSAPVSASEATEPSNPWDIHPRQEVQNMIRTYKEQQQKQKEHEQPHEVPAPRLRTQRTVPEMEEMPRYVTPPEQRTKSPSDVDESNQAAVLTMIRLYKEQENEHNRYLTLQHQEKQKRQQQEKHLQKLQQHKLNQLQFQQQQQEQQQHKLPQLQQPKPPPKDDPMLKTFNPTRRAAQDHLEKKVEDTATTHYMKRREPINKPIHRRTLVDQDDSKLYPPKKNYPQQPVLPYDQQEVSSQDVSSSSSSLLAIVSPIQFETEQPSISTRKTLDSKNTLPHVDDISVLTVSPVNESNTKAFEHPPSTPAATTTAIRSLYRTKFQENTANVDNTGGAKPSPNHDDTYLWKRPRRVAPTVGLEAQKEDIPMMLQLFPFNRHSHVERLMEQGHSIQTIFVILANEEKNQQNQL